eukprot:TRINITY_DN844_c3_g1_i1.p1 TRINITY_DN844_c3_g1~~TRINITY_DN844_c3_g1_i1.p1  ORF type:complete len:549 (+),score=168.75 TRINITY_DN844_c3_g1_i1:1013-2659(+)
MGRQKQGVARKRVKEDLTKDKYDLFLEKRHQADDRGAGAARVAESDEDEEILPIDVDSDNDSEEEEEEDDGLGDAGFKYEDESKYADLRSTGKQDEEEDGASEIGWGRKKQIFYNRDVDDAEWNEAAAKDELEEALALQKQQKEQLAAEDYLDALDETTPLGQRLAHQVKLKGAVAAKSTRDKDTAETKSLTQAFEDEMERVERDVSSMTSSEKLDLVRAESPELLGFLGDFKVHMQRLREVVWPLLRSLRKDGFDAQTNGMRYLELEFQLLLSFLYNISFYLHLKAQGRRVATVTEDGTLSGSNHHPVIDQLVAIKRALLRLQPLKHALDKKMSEMVDDAENQGFDGAGEEEEQEDGEDNDSADSDQSEEQEEEKSGKTAAKKGKAKAKAKAAAQAEAESEDEELEYEKLDDDKVKKPPRKRRRTRYTATTRADYIDTQDDDEKKKRQQQQHAGSAKPLRTIIHNATQEARGATSRKDFNPDSLVTYTNEEEEKRIELWKKKRAAQAPGQKRRGRKLDGDRVDRREWNVGVYQRGARIGKGGRMKKK